MHFAIDYIEKQPQCNKSCLQNKIYILKLLYFFFLSLISNEVFDYSFRLQ